jgi:hypothetical protein
MENLTKNYVRVLKHRLKKSKVPDFFKLLKIQKYISENEFTALVYKAINSYQTLIENTTTPAECSVTKRDGGNACINEEKMGETE